MHRLRHTAINRMRLLDEVQDTWLHLVLSEGHTLPELRAQQMTDIVERLRIDRHTPRDEWIWRKVAKEAADVIERLTAERYQLLSGLHIARGALLGIGGDYAKEVAEHLAGVIDPTLKTAPVTQDKRGTP